MQAFNFLHKTLTNRLTWLALLIDLGVLGGQGCGSKPHLENCPSTGFTDQLRVILEEYADTAEGYHHGPLIFHTGPSRPRDTSARRFHTEDILPILSALPAYDLPNSANRQCLVEQPDPHVNIQTWTYQAIDEANTTLKRSEYILPPLDDSHATPRILLTYYEVDRNKVPGHIRLYVSEKMRLESFIVDQDTFHLAYEDRLVIQDSIAADFESILGYQIF